MIAKRLLSYSLLTTGLFVSLSISITAVADPAQIVIIRHGEKFSTAPGPYLDPQGCARAYSLAYGFGNNDVKNPKGFFITNQTVNQYGAPAAIYAMKPGSTDKANPDNDSSVRPIETIAPTAQAINSKYGTNLQVQDIALRLDYATMVNAISGSTGNPAYNGKTVLISWEHKALPGLAQAFGAKLQDGQDKWPGDVFDEAWVLTPKLKKDGAPKNDSDKPGKVGTGDDGSKWDLTIIPEQALPSDNPNGGDAWSNPAAPALTLDVITGAFPQCNNDDALNAIVSAVTNPPVNPGDL